MCRDCTKIAARECNRSVYAHIPKEKNKTKNKNNWLHSCFDSNRRKFANQNLRTHLLWVAKRIRKSARKSQKVINLTLIQLTCDQLVSTCVGWPNGENLRRLVYEWPKSMQVNTSGWPKKTQVENLIALTCVDSVRVRLARRLLDPVTKKQKNWLETDQQVSLP